MLEFICNDKKYTENAVKVVLVQGSDRRQYERIGKLLNESAKAMLENVAEHAGFKGKSEEAKLLDNGAEKLLLIGVGENADAGIIRKAGGIIAEKLKKEETAAVFIPGNLVEYAADLALGMELGVYSFDKYFSHKKAEEFNVLDKVYLIPEKGKIAEKPMIETAALTNAVRYARDLCNEPGNYLTPAVFAGDVKRLEYLGLKVEILEGAALKENGFNLLAEVGKASPHAPRAVIIRWQGDKSCQEYDLVLAGKGVTFDAGGTNIKTGKYFEDMKMDMAGAAAVVAVMKAAALAKRKINLAAVIGLTENMPDGKAYKPEDVLVTASGQTVEINDTDAEGRLVLADCLWYAGEKLGAAKIIDVATLTGATAYIFGGVFAAVLGNDLLLNKELILAGEESGERLWELPAVEDFEKMFKSNIADMKNCGERKADASQAACFLKKFVKQGTSWAHLDIAGCESSGGENPLTPKGATGFGVRLLNQYIRGLK